MRLTNTSPYLRIEVLRRTTGKLKHAPPILRACPFLQALAVESEGRRRKISVAAMLIGRRMRGKLCAGVCGGTMAANALIDTGAMLALLDRTDRWHRTSVDAFEQLRLPLVASEAVLTELFHLVGDSRHEMEAAWRFVRSGAIVLAAVEDWELPQVQALMSHYADFDTYRIEGRRRFRVLPASQP